MGHRGSARGGRAENFGRWLCGGGSGGQIIGATTANAEPQEHHPHGGSCGASTVEFEVTDFFAILGKDCNGALIKKLQTESPSNMLDKLSLLTCIAVSCSSTFSPAQASTQELEDAIVATFDWDVMHPKPDERKKSAQAILAYWQDFNDRIPRLSPKEDEWVKDEMAAEGDRRNRVMSSKEYALQQLTYISSACVRYSQRVLGALEDSEQADGEMFYWSKLVNCYTDMEYTVRLLQQAELSNGRFDGPIYVARSSPIRNRVLNVLLASAMADTMDWTLEPEQEE